MRTTTLNYARGAWSRSAPVDDDGADTLVLAFAAAGFRDHAAPLAELRRLFPRSCLVGCSTSGEIAGCTISDETISAAVVRFERSRVRVSRVPVVAGGSYDAGVALAGPLSAPDLKALLVVSDGLAVNGSALIQGINSVLPSGVMVTGGLAGDGARFERTWVLDDAGRPAASMVTAVGLYGEHVRVSHGSKGGWDPFGPERLVTRSVGNVLYELDGRPALELYKTYLGERAVGLPGTALLFPLSLRMRESDRRLVRTVLAVDDVAQSMTFAGDIEIGARAQLMKANFDRLVQGASDAATMACDVARAQPVLSIAISCVGRRLVLGQRSEEETAAVLDILPAGSEQVGFYSYGELSPYVRGGPCNLHNQTMTLTTIAEA